MRNLVYNIMYAQPPPVTAIFSVELKELYKEMLMKNPKQRPSINNILSKSIIRQRISTILNPTEVKVGYFRYYCEQLIDDVCLV